MPFNSLSLATIWNCLYWRTICDDTLLHLPADNLWLFIWDDNMWRRLPSSHWLKIVENDISAYFVTSDNICILVTICAVCLYIYCRRRQYMQDDNICRNTCWSFFKHPKTCICPQSTTCHHVQKLIYHCVLIVFPGKTKMPPLSIHNHDDALGRPVGVILSMCVTPLSAAVIYKYVNINS